MSRMLWKQAVHAALEHSRKVAGVPLEVYAEVSYPDRSYLETIWELDFGGAEKYRFGDVRKWILNDVRSAVHDSLQVAARTGKGGLVKVDKPVDLRSSFSVVLHMDVRSSPNDPMGLEEKSLYKAEDMLRRVIDETVSHLYDRRVAQDMEISTLDIL